MIIGIAGPYSADTEEKRKRNLDAMNSAACRVLEMGHIPLIGVNAALPVVQMSENEDKYESIMKISLALMRACDAILMTGESPGALREKEFILARGLPVYSSISEIPPAETD